jgi:hypothetical protein
VHPSLTLLSISRRVMKVRVLSSTIIVGLFICGEKFLIFYNKSEEGKNIKRREWKNFRAGEQFST